MPDSKMRRLKGYILLVELLHWTRDEEQKDDTSEFCLNYEGYHNLQLNESATLGIKT